MVIHIGKKSLFSGITIITTFLISVLIQNATLPTASAVSSITLNVSNNVMLNVIPTSPSGTFTSSSTSTSNISITTTNFTGYTLGIETNDSTKSALTNTTDSTKTIPSISSSVSGANYADSTYATSNNLNNTWGYRPSKYNSVDNTETNNYYPAPTSTDTIDQTSGANSETANTYNIALGTRVNRDQAPGSYTNTMLITAVGNPVGYAITYNKNTVDDVTDMPNTNPQTGVVDDTTPTITLASAPTRSGYTFLGWCTAQVSDGNSCSGTEYQAGDTYTIDYATNNTFTLYARWGVSTKAVTLDLDSNVSSVTFYSSTYGSQTVTPQDSTVNLRPGTEYTISATFADGYTFSSWSTTANGTLGSTTANPTTYTITNTATLTLTSELKQQYTVTVNLNSNFTNVTFTDPNSQTQTATTSNNTVTLYNDTLYTVTATMASGKNFGKWSTDANGSLSSTTNNPTTYMISGASTLTAIEERDYMQNFTYAECQELTVGTNKVLYDIRDESAYTIARLQDDNCWMTSDLHIGSTTESMTLTAEDTDTLNNFTLPIVETSETKTQWGEVNSSVDLNVAHAYQYSGTKNLYNWYTATAGTSYDSNSASTSICPRDWKLPTWSQTDYYVYSRGESNGTTNLSIITDPPLSFTGGLYDVDQVAYANKAYWVANGWSSGDVYYGYHFGVQNVSGVDQVQTNYGYQKMVGLGVRCILSINAAPRYSVTASLDAHTSSVTFTDTSGYTQTATAANPVVRLKEDEDYVITANASSGYEFSSWSTTANGDLDSTSANPTTYTVTGTATLSVTTTVAPSYTVTVNLDQHTTGVTLENQELNFTQTITTSGSTVTLHRNTEYVISATFDTDYKLDEWTTTSAGDIYDEEGNPTGFTITGTATLSASSKARPDTTLLAGGIINSRMRGIANCNTDTWTACSNIKSIQKASSVPYPEPQHLALLTSDSNEPVTAWYDNTNNQGIIYYQSDAKNVYMNSSAGELLYNLTNLSDISGLSYIITDNMTDLTRTFAGTAITDFSPVSNWNTSNVTGMSGTFSYLTSQADLSDVAGWNTSKVTSMNSIFSYAKITQLPDLSNWDTSKVESFYYAFADSSITDFSGISSWNTSSLTDMSSMFQFAAVTNLNSFAPQGNGIWDTSKVTTMDSIFMGASSLSNITGIANWNTSSLTNLGYAFDRTAITNVNALTPKGNGIWDTSKVWEMGCIFRNTSSLTSLSGITNWDTSSLSTLDSFLMNATSLSDLSPLQNWDTSKVTGMSYMLMNASNVTDLSPLANWNTSNVYSMRETFAGISVTDLDDLAPKGNGIWDTSKVNTLLGTFRGISTLTDISGVANWDVHYATDFRWVFADNPLLTDASPINDWNVTGINYSEYSEEMFNSTPTHAVFTKRAGYWNSDNSFILSSTSATITLTIPTGASITVSNSTYGSITVTTSGKTLALIPSTSYNIVANMPSGQQFSGWTKTGGTIGNASAASTTYTPSGSATLSLGTATTMQGWTGCSSLSSGSTVNITDTRDNSTYKVAKLSDGNCWMLDNLRLGDNTTIALTPSNTNISSNWTLPASTTSGASYTSPTINSSTKNSTSTSYGSGSGKRGVYYNFCAASAGTYCYAENNGINVSNTEYDITGDICPAGWHLPTTSEYQSFSANNFVTTLSTPLSGEYNFDTGTLDSQGSYGFYWNSTYFDASEMGFHTVGNVTDPNGGLEPSIMENRTLGRSVRCMIESQ